MYENVIVIGCDKTGKTTLIESIRKALPEFEFFKGNKMPSPAEAVAKAKEIMMERDQTDKGYIFDRFHFPDDFVYHPIFTGEQLSKTIVDRYFRWVFPELKKRSTLFIYCYAGAETIAERFVMEREELVNIEKIEDILDGYIGVLGFIKEHFPIIVLNSEHMSKEQMFDLSIEAIKEGNIHGTSNHPNV